MLSTPIKFPPELAVFQHAVTIGSLPVSSRWDCAIQLPNVAPKREREFIAGRYCASQSLAQLDEFGVVTIAADRSPQWPASTTGSISHSNQIAWAAVARTGTLRAIGIDIEPIANRATASEIQSQVLTEEELKRLTGKGLDVQTATTLAFSAKESVYKCVSRFGFSRLEFLDLSIDACDMQRSVVHVTTTDPHNVQSSRCHRSSATSAAVKDQISIDVQFALQHNDIYTTCFLPARQTNPAQPVATHETHTAVA